MKNTTSFLLLVSFMFISGCIHTATIRPTIDVTATIANQLDFNVGLYIPPEVKSSIFPRPEYTF